MAAVEFEWNGDVVRSTTSPTFQGKSPKYSVPDALSPTEFSQENVISDSVQRPDEWPLPAIPTGSLSRTHGPPLAPVHANAPQSTYPRLLARARSFESGDDAFLRRPIRRPTDREPDHEADLARHGAFNEPIPFTSPAPYRPKVIMEASEDLQRPQPALTPSLQTKDLDLDLSQATTPSQPGLPHSRNTSGGSLESILENGELNQPLQYQHQSYEPAPSVRFTGTPPQFSPSHSAAMRPLSSDRNSLSSNRLLGIPGNNRSGTSLPRPSSAYSSSSEHGMYPQDRSPQLSPRLYARAPSSNSGRSPDSRPSTARSPESRPISYIDLLNVPYPQPPPAPTSLDNTHLRTAVGRNASLLSTKQTLEMYRANVKKTNDATIQYEFAVFMVKTAQEAGANGQEHEIPRQPSPKPGREDDSNASSVGSQAQLLREARHILQRLSDRSYPYAQYYLADGYASGLFNKGAEDYDRAFPLFIAASKHGHAEAGYRAALCYEFGWGTRKDPQKAVQFYRQSASKTHPGAMSRLGRACLMGDLGLISRQREGLKWLKRASESADYQYNSAPYELGLLHETGYGDDIFQDESYAAQLFTQAADLGHMEANYRLGDAYEHGKLGCPRDPALSVHFYTGAAQQNHPLAMMALCAWYMVGAEPVLDKDENEAYEWARKAAETGEPFILIFYESFPH